MGHDDLLGAGIAKRSSDNEWRLRGRYILAAASVGCAISTGIPPANAEPPRYSPVILEDQQNYTKGNYTAYASPWSIFFDKTLKHGPDYLDIIKVAPKSFPDGTLIRTQWPIDHPMPKGVWGYIALGFGNYDGGKPQIPVRSLQVKDIRILEESFNYKWDYSPNFNLLNEFYLTSRAGDADSKIIEIGFLLHAPNSNWANSATPVGTFIDASKQLWSIRRAGNYVMIFPQDGRDILSGRINLLSFIKFLNQKGVITGREWFNGIAFGVEPTKGAALTQIFVNQWRVLYR